MNRSPKQGDWVIISQSLRSMITEGPYRAARVGKVIGTKIMTEVDVFHRAIHTPDKFTLCDSEADALWKAERLNKEDEMFKSAYEEGRSKYDSQVRDILGRRDD